MKNKNLTLVRLNKEEQSLLKDPPPNILVRRKGVLDFHFCLYNLAAPYQNGFYHGVMQLAEDYPFSPPKIKFFTPSGRFEVNSQLCTTFTNFHKEEWSTAWNVRSMLMALVSFVMGREGGTGWISNSLDMTKRKHAAESLEKNMKNPVFVELFREDLLKLKNAEIERRISSRPTEQMTENRSSSGTPKKPHPEDSNAVYILICLLVLIVILYAFLKKYTTNSSSEF